MLQHGVMLCVVGSNLKMVKFFTQRLWMLHDVVVWQGSSGFKIAAGTLVTLAGDFS